MWGPAPFLHQMLQPLPQPPSAELSVPALYAESGEFSSPCACAPRACAVGGESSQSGRDLRARGGGTAGVGSGTHVV